MGMKYHERNRLPAQLAGALKDKARQMFYDLEPKEQEKILEQGLDNYLKAIKDVVLEGAVPEASRYFSEYFQEFSRNKGEGMKSYCTRHNRVLERLEAALRAVSTPKTSLWNLIKGKVPEKPEISGQDRRSRPQRLKQPNRLLKVKRRRKAASRAMSKSPPEHPQ